ncbi:hypothetical protein BXZ70DRAFT_767554 [Cristinia sonorae]|uniref:Wax synthase domain-containing protein n=1 Tax=Cristinia sonorae TaxID=1940300 RepID=A0A8K0XSH5_9AGAR|nr:hypothetical protein BXZ70DRAFT_767554 [Cristinia sonorae]
MEMSHIAQTIFRSLVPLPQDRITLTWNNAHYASVHMLPVAMLAYLVRRRNTELLRLALLPLTVMMSVRCTFGYSNPTTPETFLLNWLRGLAGLSAIALALDCALSSTSRMKLGETPKELPPLFGSDNPEASPTSPWWAEILEVQLTFRGIGWNFGKGVYIHPEHRPMEFRPFVLSHLRTYIKGYLAIDAVQAFFKYTPGLGAPYGASIWNATLPPYQRYVASTLVHIMCGAVIQFGLEMNYSLATIVAVTVFGQSPAAWPPVYGNPWKSKSVHDFWAKQWHQLLRRNFMVFGGIPGQWLAGRVGAVMGTFIASGLFHEFGLYLVGRGMDHRVTLFFMLQGVAILMEKVFMVFTGHRVEGWTGRIWTYMWILGFGQLMHGCLAF